MSNYFSTGIYSEQTRRFLDLKQLEQTKNYRHLSHKIYFLVPVVSLLQKFRFFHIFEEVILSFLFFSYFQVIFDPNLVFGLHFRAQF